MAVVLILIALILIVAAMKGQTARVTEILQSDLQAGFSSVNQFGAWLVVILILSAVGSYKPLKPVSDGFIVLILIVFLLRNQGFFPKVVEAFR